MEKIFFCYDSVALELVHDACSALVFFHQPLALVRRGIPLCSPFGSSLLHFPSVLQSLRQAGEQSGLSALQGWLCLHGHYSPHWHLPIPGLSGTSSLARGLRQPGISEQGLSHGASPHLAAQLEEKERMQQFSAGTGCIPSAPSAQAETSKGLCYANKGKAHRISPSLHTTSGLYLYIKQDFVQQSRATKIAFFCELHVPISHLGLKEHKICVCTVPFLHYYYCHCCYKRLHLTLIWGRFPVHIASILPCTRSV